MAAPDKVSILYVWRNKDGYWHETLRAPRIDIVQDDNGTLFRAEDAKTSIFIPHASGTMSMVVDK